MTVLSWGMISSQMIKEGLKSTQSPVFTLNNTTALFAQVKSPLKTEHKFQYKLYDIYFHQASITPGMWLQRKQGMPNCFDKPTLTPATS